MDPLDLLTGSFRSESDLIVAAQQERPKTLEAQQEEKREDNSSSSSGSSSEDEPEHDQEFPTTQVLAPEEPADEEMRVPEAEKKPPISPAAARSPGKARASPSNPRNSPAKVRSSPGKSRASPVKGRSSPAKVRSSPVKARSSPAKVRSSPVKARSPAKSRSSPVKARSPAKPRSSPVKAAKPPVAPSPIVARLAEAEKKEEKKAQKEMEVDDATPEEFRAKGPEGKFTKVFPAIAKLVETGGWQIAQGMNTLFCAMPGVQFFNFKPNINVFDSKIKACWKFIQIAGEKAVDTEDQELWDMLWPIVEKEFGWFTMMCGPETWYVKPDTKFENFLPNETVFQNKKRAVLKCLAVEVGDIELGDSAEGHQVVAFAPRTVQPAPKKAKISLFKTPSPAVKSTKRTTPTSSASAKFMTPAKHVSPGSVTIGAKRKLASSASKVTKSSASKKKVKGGKAGAKKTARKKKTPISDTASDISKGDEFYFTAPEFRCSFGIVYAKLQDEGWYHRSGMFEYDYFSPTYTDATKEINTNYFRSQADLEDFLKTSGTWKRIEYELRAEHDLVVDEEREKALERHYQRLEQQAARKRNLALYGAPIKSQAPAAPKPKKSKKAAPKKVSSTPPAQSLYQAEVEAAKAAQAEERLPKMKFGTVLKKLISRGWYYRPGRFEYDYFKPSANPKTAVSGEERFESTSALEIYLKTTGLWEQIAEEVAHDELAKHDAPADDSPERRVKRSKLESPPPASAQSPKKSLNGGVQKEDVKAITNDIWANSHEFDFNE
ncbi:hypothetical protein PHYPSEUDO_001664 [Phytophthora pseudosyringae]|uniref:Uncharacterized protein n=1 Tax=Phytophthora pseudosyringae TaxID=221518 RepID=A0A8T1VZG8_9STRA|nr:hypothetical protein PHYPSEUDO_001664 [Phytophthora pseudosyringae]